MSAGCEYMGGTRGSYFVYSADNVLEMSVVPRVRGVTVPTCPSNASVMIRSKRTLKSMGDSRHPCIDPLSNRSIVENCAGCIYI